MLHDRVLLPQILTGRIQVVPAQHTAMPILRPNVPVHIAILGLRRPADNPDQARCDPHCRQHLTNCRLISTVHLTSVSANHQLSRTHMERHVD